VRISVASLTPYLPANGPVSEGNPPDSTNFPTGNNAPQASGDGPAAAASAGQNLPSTLSDTTTAALLRLQEVDDSVATSGAAYREKMTAGLKVGDGTFQRLTVANATPIAELPEEQYQAALDGLQRGLEANAMQMENMTPPDTSYLANHPALKTYATVEVGGKVVATIDNQGVMSSSNELNARLKDIVPNDIDGTNGPNLAQARADKIASALGGKVVKATTAITQAQFNANPIDPEKLRPQINPDALTQDPMYAQIQAIKTQRAAYLAQQAT
jgi:hypothetical protein